jgi:ABC-type antimicrobial peptide transport system permease subunit
MFFTYLYRELRRRHRQALLTALGLGLGVALVVVVAATTSGVRDAQDQVLHSLYGVGTDITVSQTAQRDSGGPMQFGMDPGGDRQGETFSRDRVFSSPGLSTLSSEKVTTIAGLDGVDSAVGSLSLNAIHMTGKFAEMQPGSTSGAPPTGSSGTSTGSGTSAQPTQAPINIAMVSVSGVDVSDQSIGPLSSTTIASGRTFAADETTAKVAVLDSGYAKQEGYGVGDKVSIGGEKFTVVGISKAASANANVYIPLARAQKLADVKGKVNQIYVKATSATQIAQVKLAIKGTISGATVTTAADLASQVSGSLSSASKLSDQLGKWLAIAALIAAIAVASLLTLSNVSRRVREFGTLKAIGWRSRRIVSQVLGESFVTGLFGGVLGIAFGFAGAWLVERVAPSLEATVGAIGVPTMGAGGPPGMADAAKSLSHTVTVSLDAAISPAMLGLAIGLAIAGGLIAGGLGGWRAARLSPADAMRRVD